MDKSTYHVQFWRLGDDHPAYKVGVEATCEEDAIIKAREFLVKNAWWPSRMTDQEKREHLMVHKVDKIVEEAPYKEDRSLPNSVRRMSNG